MRGRVGTMAGTMTNFDLRACVRPPPWVDVAYTTRYRVANVLRWLADYGSGALHRVAGRVDWPVLACAACNVTFTTMAAYWQHFDLAHGVRPLRGPR
jgi:hypothetical protein